ncbi:class I SAM-dependent methyltransferase [Melioribacter sp. OK-6-Me]|uniref:class I SAM-dependent methyltransferase n=1 Tax=unclassified Melioribacter TaxID=2627329 RepID=UPI003EDAACA1
MNNPWEKIDLNIYETHMSSKNVFQLQTLNKITKEQLTDYDNSFITILGIAGGNGLEHIDCARTKKVYGIDVNKDYLKACRERYPNLNEILELIHCDLTKDDVILPESDVLICNLIVEYIGEKKFAKLIQRNRKNVKVISCTIQINDGNGFVSRSEVQSAFDCLSEIHNDIDKNELVKELAAINFACIKEINHPLPNGKRLMRIDFRNNDG